MKNIPLILFMLCLIGVSCNKPLPDYSTEPFDYTIAGDTDISLPANDVAYFSATLSLVSGNAAIEPIIASFKGIPANVTMQNDSFTFRLNYSFSNTFTARNATQGIYPMQITYYNASMGAKTYNFKLNIISPINRVALFCANYVPSNTCVPYEFLSCIVDSVPGQPNEIMLIDRNSVNNSISTVFYDTTYATVDCCSNTFTIPTQIVRGATITGNGSLMQGNINISKTIITDTSDYTCPYTLSPPI